MASGDDKGEQGFFSPPQNILQTALYQQQAAFPYPSFFHSRKLTLTVFPQRISELVSYNEPSPLW